MPYEINQIRDFFPILQRKVGDHPLVYLDSAASALTPEPVLEAMNTFYREGYSNVKRGVHPLSEEATTAYEEARKAVQKFLNAEKAHECIFTSGTTEAINLVARSWGEENLKEGDVVLLSLLEHHSNIVPWQQLAARKGIRIEWIELNEDGTLNDDVAREKIKNLKPKLMCLSCISNVHGMHTLYTQYAHNMHMHGGRILLDAAQLAPHAPIDVQEMDCDFLVFSGHKVYGPTGIGVLYGKEELLADMPPFLGGGGMIERVDRNGFKPTHLPDRHEAGTPPIAEAIGLHAAIEFINEIGWDAIQSHEKELMNHAIEKLGTMESIQLYGSKESVNTMGCLSFSTPIHPHDLTEYLGNKGICMRAGHHCCQPLHDHLGVAATTRMSFGIYNTTSEIDQACAALEEAISFFSA